MVKERMLKAQPTKNQILLMMERIKDVRVGVIGDGCLDVYWDVDMRISELSRETPHHPLPVIKERMYPGAGTNVAANIKSLGSSIVYMLSLIGEDWRGDCLKTKLLEEDIKTQYLLTSDKRITPTYCKPMRKGHSELVYEDPRIDFENWSPMTYEQEEAILEALQEMVGKVDIIAVCDQFKYGVISKRIRQELEKLALEGKKIIVDSRSRIGLFSHVILKPNEIEAMAAVYKDQMPEAINHETIMEGAIALYKKNHSPVIVTMGSQGSIWYDGEDFYLADEVPVEPPIDIVGAGDAFIAGFSCAYGAGFTGPESIAFGNLVSSVVIKKIGMAGTATPDEIIEQLERV